MWIIIVVIIVVAGISMYNSDRSELRKNVIQKGGLDEVFKRYIQSIALDFADYKIVKMTETEIEIFARTNDGQNFVFANKLGFGEKVNYRCDPKRSSFLNAEIVVLGNISNQVQSYQMIVNELLMKYGIEVGKT